MVDNDIAKFSKIEILGDEKEFVWIIGLPDKLSNYYCGFYEFVSNGDTVNYIIEDIVK